MYYIYNMYIAIVIIIILLEGTRRVLLKSLLMRSNNAVNLEWSEKLRAHNNTGQRKKNENTYIRTRGITIAPFVVELSTRLNQFNERKKKPKKNKLTNRYYLNMISFQKCERFSPSACTDFAWAVQH